MLWLQALHLRSGDNGQLTFGKVVEGTYLCLPELDALV